MMKNFKILLFLVLMSFVATAENNQMLALSVSGNTIVDDNGNVIRLEGVSLADPDKLEREGHWSERIFLEAADWGSNVVRFPVHPYTWRYRGSENYLKLLDQGIEWAAKNNLYVIIDWHSIGNMVSDKYPHFNYATSWKETAAFWRLIAEKYKNNNTVAFYELFNEPTAQGAELSWETWKPVMEKLIDEINSIDEHKIKLVAGMNWAYYLDEVVDNPVKRKNVAYVAHPYPQKRDQPWEPQWEKDWGHVADHYPIVVTEFGFVGEGERGEHIPVIGTEEYGQAIMAFFDERGISYTLWCFDPSWSPAVFESWDFTLSRQGRFFKEAMKRNRN